TVNVAHRLERVSKNYDAAIVASSDLVHDLKCFRLPINFKRIDGVQLLGREAILDILYLPMRIDK
ncbi:hypothetical protein, partial [Roseibium sp.]